MSIEVKPGRWRMRNGELVIVEDGSGKGLWPWRGHVSGAVMSWAADGRYLWVEGPHDLVEYYGPAAADGWRMDLIPTNDDIASYGLVYETAGKLADVHQNADGLWVVRHLYASQMVLHGAYSDLCNAISAAEHVCR